MNMQEKPLTGPAACSKTGGGWTKRLMRLKWMKDKLTKSGEGGRQGDTALKSWREMQQQEVD